MTSLFLIATVFLYIKGEFMSSVICLVFSIITYFNKDSKIKKAYKTLNKTLLYEFPRCLYRM